MTVLFHPTENPARSEEQAYDDMPYESRAFPQSQPARLAATAHLLGLNPPPVETARVLELGCASGGNLIPLALHYPEARFVGVDISGKQITDGQRFIDRLALKNIELRHAGIESITAADGKFDYIICHGIYSWVPEPVRDALLRVCGENLTDEGVAFVSYNTLPGWHFVQPVRDMMLYWTEGITDPKKKVQAALEVLDSVKECAEELAAGVYGKEANTLRLADASYVMHDHLEQVNAPCYLKDFVAHAERHALAYLCDVSFQHDNPLSHTALLAEHVGKYAGDDIVRTGQYLDFVHRRRFRQSLLVKQSQQPRINRSSALTRLDGLHFRLISELAKEPAVSARLKATWWPEEADIYRVGTKAITARSQTASRAWAWMAQHATDSATFTLEDLMRHATPADAAASADKADKRHVEELIWALMDANALRCYSCAIAVPAPAAEAPAASTLAQAAAALGHSSTSNAFHDQIRITDKARTLLNALNGARTHAELAQMLGPEFPETVIREGLDELKPTLVLC